MKREADRPLTAARIEDAADMFAALADPSRLRLLVLLTEGEASVTNLAERQGEKISTVSARLQVLHGARLVRRKRHGKSIMYDLADDHVIALVSSAIEHVCEDHDHDHDEEY